MSKKRIRRYKKNVFARYTLDGTFIEMFPSVSDLKKAGYSETTTRLVCTGHTKKYKNCLWRYVVDGVIPNIKENTEKRALYIKFAKLIIQGELTLTEASIFNPALDKSTLGNYVQRLRVTHKAEFLGKKLYEKKDKDKVNILKIHPKVLIEYSHALEVLEMHGYIYIKKEYDLNGSYDTIVTFIKKKFTKIDWDGDICEE